MLWVWIWTQQNTSWPTLETTSASWWYLKRKSCQRLNHTVRSTCIEIICVFTTLCEALSFCVKINCVYLEISCKIWVFFSPFRGGMVKSHWELVSTTLCSSQGGGKGRAIPTFFVRSCFSVYQITFPVTKGKKSSRVSSSWQQNLLLVWKWNKNFTLHRFC